MLWRPRSRPSIITCAGLFLIHSSNCAAVISAFEERQGTRPHRNDARCRNLHDSSVLNSEVGDIIFCTGRELLDMVEPIQRDNPNPRTFRDRMAPIADRFIQKKLSHSEEYQMIVECMPHIKFTFSYVMMHVFRNLRLLNAIGDHMIILQVEYMPVPGSMTEEKRMAHIQKFKTHSIGPTCNGKTIGNEPMLHTLARELAEEVGLTLELSPMDNAPPAIKEYASGKGVSKTSLFIRYLHEPRSALRVAPTMYYFEAHMRRSQRFLEANQQILARMFDTSRL